MKRRLLDHIVDLTRQCLERFWQGDCLFLLGHCDPDVTYIGMVEAQFCVGYEAIEADFRRAAGKLIESHLVNATFTVVSNSPDACVVAVSYLSTTDPATNTYLQFPQRGTFAWVQTGQGPRIKHIHVSGPLRETYVVRGEIVPHEMGRLTRAYLERRIDALLSNRRLVVRDDRGTAHFLRTMDVLYVKAAGKRSIVHTLEGPIPTPEAYGAITKRLPDGFIDAHRSYTVNIEYIKRVEPRRMWLQDGSEIPVPRRNCAALKARLWERYGNPPHDGSVEKPAEEEPGSENDS